MRQSAIQRAITVFIVALLYAVPWVALGPMGLSGGHGAEVAKESRDEIRKTINTYNKILLDFYASNGGYSLLDDFPAAKQLRHEVFRDLGFLRRYDLVMVYDMADVKFRDFSGNEDGSVSVRTREDWNFMYQKLPDRGLVQEPKGFTHEYEYRLEPAGDGWTIIDVSPMDLEEEAADGGPHER